MTRKIYAGALFLFALLTVAQPSLAGHLTGSLKGKITDQKGSPLSGAHVYVTSPVLLGVKSLITSKSGVYYFLHLSPGTYKITVEIPDFKTVNVESVSIGAGSTLKMVFKMEPTELEEEMSVRKTGPTLDTESVRHASVLDHDLIVRLPLPRDFPSLLGLVPGVVFANDQPGYIMSVHGSQVTNNAFVDGGGLMTDPVAGGALARINVDLVDQVIIESSAIPVDRNVGQGAYINVVHKMGANMFEGGLFLSYTGRALTHQLWSSQDLSSTTFASPSMDRENYDVSLTADGPVIKDVAWFFSNVRFQSKTQTTPFQAWTDPLGNVKRPYDLKDTDIAGTFKLTTRVLSQYEGFVEVGFSTVREPVYAPDASWNKPLSTTRSLDRQSSFLARGGLTYLVSQSTIFDLSVGFTKTIQPLLLNSEGSTEPTYYDIGTGYNFGGAAYNDREKRRRLSADATITRLQDKLFGASHELVAGLDYDASAAISSVWKLDNLVMPYFWGSPYNLGQAVSPYSGNTVGAGLVGFSILPMTEGGLSIQRELKQLGVFAQDTMTFGGRIALCLGIRYDHADIRFLQMTKAASGNTISEMLGESLIRPVYGLNPFLSGSFAGWDGVIRWNGLSPRAGLNIDLLGTGRTLLRASVARIPESLGLGYALTVDLIPPARAHNFRWYDENGDGVVSAADTYVLAPYNYNVYKTDFFSKQVDPDLRPPMMDEWTVGLEQEITRDFTLSLCYISRSQKNGVGYVLYDPDTGTPWYSLQGSPAGRWVPFPTVVPTTGSYGDTPVTVYFPSTSAPAEFDRIQNVPELQRKYRALEFTLRKRMSGNWQFFGSVVWSRSTGTIGPSSPWSIGLPASPLTPNAFVNVDSASRTDFDRPLAVRAMGTVRFRWDFYLSLYYRLMSGAPWARMVTIIPPAAWAEANQVATTPVTVYLESPGARRYGTRQTTDLRLEKEFKRAGRTRLSLYVDVFNLLGNKYQAIDGNDGGTWAPAAEGSSAGVRVLGMTYGQPIVVTGLRTIRFSLSLRF